MNAPSETPSQKPADTPANGHVEAPGQPSVRSLEQAKLAYPSLADLRDAHSAMVKEVGTNVLAESNLRRIAELVFRGKATGAVLDCPDDRAAAQALINFWVGRVMSEAHIARRAGATEKIELPDFDDTLLDEFNSYTIRQVIAQVENWLKIPSNLDKEALTRRILLRLVRLCEDDQTFMMRASVQGICEGLDPQFDAEEVLANLERLGIIRKPLIGADNTEVALRFEELMTQWPRFAAWMNERREFRKLANAWAHRRELREKEAPKSKPFFRWASDGLREGALRFGQKLDGVWHAIVDRIKPMRPSKGLFSNVQYEEAETFRDRNRAELRLIYEKSLLEKEITEWRQIRTTAITAVSIVGLLAALYIARLWVATANAERESTRLEAANTMAETKLAETKIKADVALLDLKKAEVELLAADALRIRLETKGEGIQLPLQHLVDGGMARAPQKQLLTAYQSLLSSKVLVKELKGVHSDYISNLNLRAEDVFRKSLASIGGFGFHTNSDIGSITAVAAHEKVRTKENERPSLDWFAAAGDTSFNSTTATGTATLALWNVVPLDPKDANRAPKASLKLLTFGLPTRVRALHFSENARWLTAQCDKSLTIWDLRATDRPFFIPGVENMQVSSKGNWIWLQESPKRGCLIDLGSNRKSPGKLFVDLEAMKEQAKWNYLVTTPSFSKDERWFARSTENGDVFIWDLSKAAAAKEHEPATLLQPVLLRNIATTTPMDSKAAIGGAFLEDGTALVTYLRDGTACPWVRIGDSWAGKKPVDLKSLAGIKKEDPALRVALSREGTHAVLLPSSDALVFKTEEIVRGKPAGRRLLAFNRSGVDAYSSFEISGDGQFLCKFLNAAGRRTTCTWDLQAAGEAIEPNVLEGPPGEYYSEFRFPPNHAMVVLREQFNMVRCVHAAAPMRESLLLKGHDARLSAMSFSQFGRWLVTGCDQGTVRLWNMNPLSSTTDPVVVRMADERHLAVTPNMVVVSLPDGTVRRIPIVEKSLNSDPGAFSWDVSRERPPNLYRDKSGEWILEDAGKNAVLWKMEHPPRRVATLDLDGFRIDHAPAARAAKASDKTPATIDVSVDRKWIAVAGSGSGEKGNWTRLWRLKDSADIPQKQFGHIPGRLLSFMATGNCLLLRPLGDDTMLVPWYFDFDQDKWRAGVSTEARGKIRQVVINPARTALFVARAQEDERNKVASVGEYWELVGPVGKEIKIVKRMSDNPIQIASDDFIRFSANGKMIWAAPANAQARPTWHWFVAANDATPGIFCGAASETPSSRPTAEYLAHSADNRWLVTRENNEAYLWDLKVPDAAKLTPKKKLGSVESARFTFHSDALVTAGSGKFGVYLLASLDSKPHTVTWPSNVQFSAAAFISEKSSHRLALVYKADNGYFLHAWEIDDVSFRPLAKELIPQDSSNVDVDLLFRDDGKRIYLFFDKKIQVVSLDLNDLIVRATAAIGRNLSRAEWQKGLGEFQETFPGLPVPTPRRLIPSFPGRIASKPSEIIKDSVDSKTPQDKEKPEKRYPRKFDAGKSYIIEMVSGRMDPFLILRDSLGNQIHENDDSDGLNSKILFDCPKDNVYQVIATSFRGQGGEYVLTIRPTASPKQKGPGIDLSKQQVVSIPDQITTDDSETVEGFGVSYLLHVPPGKLCQVDVVSGAFEPILIINPEDGRPPMRSIGFGGKARVVFESTAPVTARSATYRVTVVATRGNPGPFDLRIESR
jgi:WD40 repeat protein